MSYPGIQSVSSKPYQQSVNKWDCGDKHTVVWRDFHLILYYENSME